MSELFGSSEAFFRTMAAYNAAIWPVQIITYILGIAAVILVLRETKLSDRIVSLIMGCLWLWSGIVFCFLYFGKSSPMFYIMGSFLILQGILFLLYSFRVYVTRVLSFRARGGSYTIVGTVMIAYAWVIYPLIGHLTGHAYPQTPVFGVAPCPVTIFTFGLLLLTHKRVPGVILVIPLLFSLGGIMAVLTYGVYADVGLVASGIIGTIMIINRNIEISELAKSSKR